MCIMTIFIHHTFINQAPPPSNTSPHSYFLVDTSLKRITNIIRFIAKQCGLLFALIICTGINSGLAQSGTGTELPSNVQQRPDGAIDFIPPITEEVTVNEEAPRNTATPQSTASTGTAQTCDKLKHCEDWQIQDASVCVVEKQEEQNKDMACSPYFSGSGMNRRKRGVDLVLKVASLDEMLEKLNTEVSNACFRIKRLTFIGGGSSGYMNIGLNNQNVSQLKPYSCLMTRNSDVLIDGSHISKGCSGRFFMQEIAENLLPPDRWASVVFRTTNNNRGYMRLQNRDEQWQYHRFFAGNIWNHRNVLGGSRRGSLPDFCRDDINDKITSIKKKTRNLMNNDGRECSRLIQCRGRRLPYADVLNNAERVAGNIRNSRVSLLDANRVSVQLLHIENVLSQCNSDTEHIGCTYQQFLGRGGSGRSSSSGNSSQEGGTGTRN